MSKPDAPQRILIIRLSSIGDCIMASALAQVLREAYPQAHIAWAVREKSRAVVEGNPFINEVILWPGGEKGLLTAIREVRRGRFDTVLELQGIARNTLLMVFSGAKRRVSSPEFWFLSRWFTTDPVRHPSGHIYPGLRYLYWARQLGIDISAYEADPGLINLTVPISPPDAEDCESLLAAAGVNCGDVLVGLNPGCSAGNRTWPPERFAAVAQELLRHDPRLKFVITGAPADVASGQIIAGDLPTSAVINAAGKLSLRASAALIRRCALLITNDTGPMHISIAARTPVVGIFGPVRAELRLPPNQGHIGLERNRTCIRGTRPICVRQPECACLASITPEEVAKAAWDKLQEVRAQVTAP